MQSRRDKEKEMISLESAKIVEERDIWPLIGAVQQKERNVQNVGGMVILLCVVRESVIIMQLEVNRISDAGVLIDTFVIDTFVGDQDASGREENCAIAFGYRDSRRNMQCNSS